jgi:hypothetical protein
MQIPPRWLPAIRLLLLFAIFASAGPEIFAALEMATLLELLGTALFVTAFGSALRMLARDVGRWLLEFFVPPALAGVYRHGGGPWMKANVVLYLSARAAHCVLLAVAIGMFGLHLWRA